MLLVRLTNKPLAPRTSKDGEASPHLPRMLPQSLLQHLRLVDKSPRSARRLHLDLHVAATNSGQVSDAIFLRQSGFSVVVYMSRPMVYRCAQINLSREIRRGTCGKDHPVLHQVDDQDPLSVSRLALLIGQRNTACLPERAIFPNRPESRSLLRASRILP